MSEDKLANVLSIELSMALLSRSLLSVRRDENEMFCGTKAGSFGFAMLVDAFEFSLCESFGLSATMGVIDIKGVLVKAGDVKLRLSFLDVLSLSEECSFFFLIFLSFFLTSVLSFSLQLNSNGLIVTLMGDTFSVFLTTLCCLYLGGELGVEVGLCGSVMMAPSLLYLIRDRRGTFFSRTSGSESDVLSHSEHCLWN